MGTGKRVVSNLAKGQVGAVDKWELLSLSLPADSMTQDLHSLKGKLLRLCCLSLLQLLGNTATLYDKFNFKEEEQSD
jgi:hypothetical protein